MYGEELATNIQSNAIFLFLIPLLLGRGGYLLLSSPCVFRIDKKKNCCTRERKFIWQRKYKIKTLCKFSEIKEAIRTCSILFLNYVSLCLNLKSGKTIIVFWDYYPGSFWISNHCSANEYDKRASEINKFLENNQQQYVAEKSLIFWGVLWTLSGFVLFTTVILRLCNLI